MPKPKPSPPNAGQATQLQVLQAAVTSTAATEAAALTTYSTAKLAAKKAATDLNDYVQFAFGNKSRPGVIDDGTENT
jgi:hypothetical protein